MAGLRDLPPELIVVVAESLNLRDVCRWALVNQHFYQAIMFNESIARHALELSAPRARETRDAQASIGRYAQGLRRSMKILNAISTGSPFQVAFVAMADNFSYTSGMLCYTYGYRTVHLLDMHSSSHEEIVIDSRRLLDAAVEESKGVNCYNFFPLHYSEGVLCCRYEQRIGRAYVSYVVIIDPFNERILDSRRIPSKSKYWVGITKTSVFVASREETTAAGHYGWVLRCFDIKNRSWLSDHIQLDGVSEDFYSNSVCFEVIGDFFYAVSVDSGRFDDINMEWNSTYFVSRHPLNNLSKPTKRHFFRRRHAEGPIHDDWTTLKLELDPETGMPMIVEARMEWLQGASPTIRTCYKTAIEFTDESLANGFSVSVPEQDISVAAGFSITSQFFPELQGSPLREPATYHRGDHGDAVSSGAPKRCCLRSYQLLCETFVDLIWEETLVEGEQPCQTMRLRTISRPHSSAVNQVTLWPPVGCSIDERGEKRPLLDALTIRGPRYSFRGAMDDRSMVVSVPEVRRARHGKKTPLLFISFDPASRIDSSGCCDIPDLQGCHEKNGVRHPSRWVQGKSLWLEDSSVHGPCEAESESWASTRPSCFGVLVSGGKPA